MKDAAESITSMDVQLVESASAIDSRLAAGCCAVQGAVQPVLV
ncbi:hypothetical protein ACWELO_34400 [Streptomyces sp. NPDC004596]